MDRELAEGKREMSDAACPSDLLPESVMLELHKLLATIKHRMIREYEAILNDPFIQKDEQFKNDEMRKRYALLVLRNRLKWLIGDNE